MMVQQLTQHPVQLLMLLGREQNGRFRLQRGIDQSGGGVLLRGDGGEELHADLKPGDRRLLDRAVGHIGGDQQKLAGGEGECPLPADHLAGAVQHIVDLGVGMLVGEEGPVARCDLVRDYHINVEQIDMDPRCVKGQIVTEASGGNILLHTENPLAFALIITRFCRKINILGRNLYFRTHRAKVVGNRCRRMGEEKIKIGP